MRSTHILSLMFGLLNACIGLTGCSRDAYLDIELREVHSDVEWVLASIEINAAKEPYVSMHQAPYQAFVSAQGDAKELSFFLPDFAEDGTISVNVRAFKGRCTTQSGSNSQAVSRLARQQMSILLDEQIVSLCW